MARSEHLLTSAVDKSIVQIAPGTLVQIALRQLRIKGRIDAHAVDGQRGPACWRGDIEIGRHDESELLTRSEHHLAPP